MPPVRIVLTFLAALVLSLEFVGSAVGEEDQPIHFIGFNKLVEGQSAQAAFDDYIEKLTPIMVRHGMSLHTFDARALPESDLETTIVTLGTGHLSGFTAFSEDPDFHTIFPDLLVVLEDHYVIFTDDDLSIAAAAGDSAVLGAYWTDDSQGFDGTATFTKGQMASHGIAESIEPLEAPQLVFISDENAEIRGNTKSRWIFRLTPRD